MNKKTNKKSLLLLAAMAPAVVAGANAVNNTTTTSEIKAPTYYASESSLVINAASSYEWTGSAPKITISSTKGTVTANTDYTVTYEKGALKTDGTIDESAWQATGNSGADVPVDVGVYRISVTPKYAENTAENDKIYGTEAYKAVYKITKRDMSKATIELSFNEANYTGSAITPTVTVKYDGVTVASSEYKTPVFSNNKNAGRATVVVEAADNKNYENAASASFTIKPIDINPKEGDKAVVTVSESSIAYTGEEVTPTITVSGLSLQESDYTVTYAKAKTFKAVDGETPETWYAATTSKPIDAGTYKVIITGKNNCTGTVESNTFKVAARDVSGYTIKYVDASGKNETTLEPQAYTGSAIRPAIVVVTGQKDGKDVLLDTANYDVEYSKNINVGTNQAEIKITGKGNYTGTKTVNFTISANIEKTNVSITNANKIYYNYGEAINIDDAIVVTLDNGTVLTKDTDYEFKTDAYKNNKEVGTATVTISGRGNYAGKKTISFNIAPLLLVGEKNALNKGTIAGVAQNNPGIKVDMASTVEFMTGGAKPRIEITALAANTDLTKDLLFVEGTDYTVTYDKNDKITTGTNKATASITFKGNYAGTYVLEYAITEMNMVDASVIAGVEKEYEYTGSEIKPEISINGLVRGTDYSVEYTNNKAIGTATITVKFQGNYKGTLTKTFKITAIDVKNLNITGVKDMEYTGKEVSFGKDLVIKNGDKILVEGKDYSIAYANNKNIGEASITITGIGITTIGQENYIKDGSTHTIKFRIGKTVDEKNVDIVTTGYTYTGKAIIPTVTVKGMKLGTDYEVTATNNVNAGTATVTVKFIGNYVGSVTKEFTIAKKSISSLKVSGFGDKNYTGKAVKQTSMDIIDGKVVLTEGTDYTVAYSNNTKVGTATMTITAKGNYTGSIKKTFKISKINVSKATITGIADKAYTGKAITQKITVKSGSTTLKAGTDYTVTYKNNKNVGTATVTITGKGNCEGKISKTFKITVDKVASLKVSKKTASSITLSWAKASNKVTGYQVYRSTSKNGTYKLVKTTTGTSFNNTGLTAGKTYYYKVRAYVTINGKKNYGSYTSVLTTATNLKAVNAKATAGTKQATIKWDKVANASGYEVMYSTSKNGSYTYLIDTTKTSYTKKSLTSGKTYYFKVRAYKVVGNGVSYSDYKTVSVKVK